MTAVVTPGPEGPRIPGTGPADGPGPSRPHRGSDLDLHGSRLRAAGAATGRGLLTLAALAAVTAVAGLILPRGLPVGVVIQGLVIGGLLSFTAMGLVLIHRSARFINFAQAAMGSGSAAIATVAMAGWGFPYALAIGVGIVLAVGVGLGMERLMVHRLGKAPRLVLTVASIGMLQLLGFNQAMDTYLAPHLNPNAEFPSPFGMHFTVAPLVFTGNDVIAMAVVPLVLLGLWWFLERTETGTAVRAVADSTERAELLGIPVRRVSAVVWIIAAVLSGVGAMLTAPILNSTPLGSQATPEDLLPALAAAVLARFESFPRAVAWSLVIGILQQGIFWSYQKSTYGEVALFVLIFLGLALQRRRQVRVDDEGLGSFVSTRDVRALPAAVARMPLVRLMRGGGTLALVAVAVLLPLTLTASRIDLITFIPIYALVTVSLVVLTGWAGQISLGQWAFVGIGGAATGVLLVHARVDLFVALLAAAAVGAVVATLLGLAALRLPGLSLAALTLALAPPVADWLLSNQYFPSLNPQTVPRPVLFGRFPMPSTSPMTFYELALAFLILGMLLAWNFRRSRAGRTVIAIRDNARAASAYGISPLRAKLTAFALSGALAGVAGGLYLLGVGGFGIGGMSATESVTVFIMAVIGGFSLVGALVGAVYLQVVSNVLPANWQLLASGVGLLTLLVWFPEGLGGLWYRLRDAVVRVLARSQLGYDPFAGPADGAQPVPAGAPPAVAGGPEPPELDADADAPGRPGRVLVAADASRSSLPGEDRWQEGTGWVQESAGIDAAVRAVLELRREAPATQAAVRAAEVLTAPLGATGDDGAPAEGPATEVRGPAEPATRPDLGPAAGPEAAQGEAEGSSGSSTWTEVLGFSSAAAPSDRSSSTPARPAAAGATPPGAGAGAGAAGGTEAPGGAGGSGAPEGSEAPEAAALVAVDGAEVRIGQQVILPDIDLVVRDGEILALLGTNGAGKSTLLRTLAGVLRPARGTILYDGLDMAKRTPQQRVAAGMAVVPGGRGVFPSLTVRENLRLAERAARRRQDPGRGPSDRAEVLALFPRLAERLGTKAGLMSGGEQQMLAIAQALLCRPRLLMIDELSLGLAPTVVSQLLDVVRGLAAEGVTVVVVEQSVNVAAALAQRAVFLERGRVRFDGPIQELAGRKDLLRSVFLGDAQVESGSAVSSEASGEDRTAPVRTEPRPAASPSELSGAPGDTGEPGGEATGAVALGGPAADPAAPAELRGAAFAALDLAKQYGGVSAVSGVSFSVAPGEILGIIGSNGAGKTTLFDLCSGFVTPDRGRVFLGGRDITRLAASSRARLGLGRMFQDARLWPSMTVVEVLATAWERHVAVRDPLLCLLRTHQVARSEAEVTADVDRLCAAFGLETYRDRFVSELSTGTRRVVELACAMAHAPSVLLLDEPTAGLAQREAEALAPRLAALCRETGTSFVIIEHDVPFVASLADRLLCMHLGEKIAEGSPREVLADPAVLASYLGEDDVAVARSGLVPTG